MEEETIVLVMLVFVMLVGSYIAGNIPLVMKLSEEKLQFVTVLGAGLLVGTALTIIIPEGIRSLYMDSRTAQTRLTLSVPGSTNTHSEHETASISQLERVYVEQDHSRIIGLSLVLGFVFMMLVDQISQKKSNANDKNITATIGLVVHAAADGVALGAAATTSHQDVEIIVFFAIMLHKAPAAFGLVSFLLHEKVERQEIRKHLGVFSISAPLLTLLTYFGIGQEQKETLNSVNATGIAMLFSAGTFLYVATVHVLPELTQRDHGAHVEKHKAVGTQLSQYEYRQLEESRDKLSTDVNILAHSRKGLRLSELIIMVFGALFPLIITFSHQH